MRTVASHRAYYERWAKTWEFQALLKARPVAGDTAVGQAYCDAVQPMVWQASSRENFVDDVQAMRRRVEQHIPAAEADRQLKLGPGGLRDVEFSVQLLQLVHGRADESLRTGTTLDGLAALSAGGYVGRDDAATLGTAYRLLRTLEHRIQLFRLRRTHLMPTAESDLRRLGRALGHRSSPAEAVVAQWRAQQREVRRLHERIFYRPLLSAVARLSDSDVRLTPEAARERLSALGFRDPRGALRHLEALTEGISRRAAIQRQLLPVMLGWFADEADPDAGLLAFRKISDELGSTHWYLRLLRDEGSAAERLAHTLARSRFAADLLEQAPECVQFLGDSAGPQAAPARGRAAPDAVGGRPQGRPGVRGAGGAHDPSLGAVPGRRRRPHRRPHPRRSSAAAMTDLTAALLEVTLEVCLRDLEQRTGAPPLTRLLVVGMGRLGRRRAGLRLRRRRRVRARPGRGRRRGGGPDPGPRGGQGADPAARAARPRPEPRRRRLAAPRGQERAARALAGVVPAVLRPVVARLGGAGAAARHAGGRGPRARRERYLALIAPIRWPEGGLDDGQVREIRTLKARMESERLPRGADRKTHFKLGHGGLSDVEWVVQLVQLRHAHAHPELRTTSTMGALEAAEQLGLVAAEHAADLAAAWRLASSMRNAGVLFRGQGARRPAHRPARRRRHRPHPGAARWVRPGAGGALPAGGPAGPRRPRGRALRRLSTPGSGSFSTGARADENGPMFISGVDEDVARARSPSTTRASGRPGASCPTTPRPSRPAPRSPGRGTPSTRRARRDGPATVRDRHDRRGPGAAVDLLHRRPLGVPARRLR